MEKPLQPLENMESFVKMRKIVVVAARTVQKSTDGFINVKSLGAFQRRRSLRNLQMGSLM